MKTQKEVQIPLGLTATDKILRLLEIARFKAISLFRK